MSIASIGLISPLILNAVQATSIETTDFNATNFNATNVDATSLATANVQIGQIPNGVGGFNSGISIAGLFNILVVSAELDDQQPATNDVPFNTLCMTTNSSLGANTLFWVDNNRTAHQISPPPA